MARAGRSRQPGANKTPWPGEINTPQDQNSFGFNWTYLKERGKGGERFVFEIANAFNFFSEMAQGHQVGVDMNNLDGGSTTQSEAISGIYTVGLFASPFKGMRYVDESNFVYRSLTSANAGTLANGEGIFAKSIEGSWTLEQHLIHGTSSKSFLHNPWIATSSDINIARKFSSGNGLIKIDLSKLSTNSFERGYLNLQRNSRGYHYSIWQQEVSIYQHIPQNAIKIVK